MNAPKYKPNQLPRVTIAFLQMTCFYFLRYNIPCMGVHEGSDHLKIMNVDSARNCLVFLSLWFFPLLLGLGLFHFNHIGERPQ